MDVKNLLAGPGQQEPPLSWCLWLMVYLRSLRRVFEAGAELQWKKCGAWGCNPSRLRENKRFARWRRELFCAQYQRTHDGATVGR